MKYKLCNTNSPDPCSECDLCYYCKELYGITYPINARQTDDEIEELIITCMSSDNSTIKLVEDT